jgi:hypothetical protein
MSTLKSSAEDLTLNADGSGNDVIIQSNGSTLVTVDGSNSRLEVKGATRITRSATSDTYLDLTMNDINVTLNAYDPDGYADWSLQSNGTEWLGYDGLAQKEVVINEDSADVDFRVESDGNANALFVDGANGDVTIGAGDLIFGTAGKGICLGVTSNTDSNTLDDYEEGTWTPILSDGTNDAVSYTDNLGRYVKIGSMVTVYFAVQASDFGSISGATHIMDLPFTVTQCSNPFPQGVLDLYATASNLTGHICLQISVSDRITMIYNAGLTGGHIAITDAYLDTGTTMRGHIQYFTH